MSSNALLKNSQFTKLQTERRILLIDDQPEFLLPLNLILTHLNVHATMVFDGFAARRALRDRSFDLVIIDWKMPDLTGGECLLFADSTLNSDSRRRTMIPVVTYSGLNETEICLPELEYFYRVDHWRKPMTLSALTKRLTSILSRLE